MHSIDELAYQSNLYHLHPGYKCMVTIISICFCVGTHSMMVGISVLCYTSFITVFIGKTNILRYFKLFLIPLAFLSMSTITLMFEISSMPLSTYALPIGSYYISIQPSSFMFAIQFIITALASVSCLYFLSVSTPMTDILQVLKDIHIPYIIIELMLLIYRLIFIIDDMASNQRMASNARLGNRNFKQSIRSTGLLMSTLFIRSFRKSSNLYDAMESRCYDGEIKVLRRKYFLHRKNIIWLFIMVLFLIGITLLHIQQIIV